MSEVYAGMLDEEFFVTIRDAISSQYSGEWTLPALKLLPQTIGWAYALTTLGTHLAQSGQEHAKVRGQTVLLNAARSLITGYEDARLGIVKDERVHVLNYDFPRLIDAQIEADDIAGARQTSQEIERLLTS